MSAYVAMAAACARPRAASRRSRPECRCCARLLDGARATPEPLCSSCEGSGCRDRAHADALWPCRLAHDPLAAMPLAFLLTEGGMS